LYISLEFAGLFILCYNILVTFAVVRVITAMFLKATLAAANTDDGHLNELKEKERSEYVELLKAAMESADIAGDTLTREELSLLNQLPRMRDWLIEVGVTEVQQDMLFDALDKGDGKISYADFMAAIERMSGPNSSAADMVVQLYQTRKSQQDLRLLIQVCQGCDPGAKCKYAL